MLCKLWRKMCQKWDWLWIVYPRPRLAPTTLCPVGSHPWTGLTASAGMVWRQEVVIKTYWMKLSCIYHQNMADRMTVYLSSNGLIDTTVQKAFMRGISGCTNHNLVLQELLAYARMQKKTLHCTFFDLADAFGCNWEWETTACVGRNMVPWNSGLRWNTSGLGGAQSSDTGQFWDRT
jgi:hypothetical protein